MKKLITLLLVLVTLNGYSQANPAKLYNESGEKRKTSYEEIKYAVELSNTLNLDSLTKEVYYIFNEYRRYVGLDTLIFDSILTKAAEIQSKYCLSISESTHSNENTNYETPIKRLKNVDKNNTLKYTGEISSIKSIFVSVNRKRSISEDILDGFYTSLPHRKILEEDYSTKIGISIHRYKDELYTIAVFGVNNY